VHLSRFAPLTPANSSRERFLTAFPRSRSASAKELRPLIRALIRAQKSCVPLSAPPLSAPLIRALIRAPLIRAPLSAFIVPSGARSATEPIGSLRDSERKCHLDLAWSTLVQQLAGLGRGGGGGVFPQDLLQVLTGAISLPGKNRPTSWVQAHPCGRQQSLRLRDLTW